MKLPNIQAIIEACGGLKALSGDNYIKLTVPGFMPLVIERIGRGPFGQPLLSIAHYGEQNGDAMRDPDVEMEVDAEWQFRPVRFRNDYLGIDHEAFFQDDQGRILVRPKLVADLKAFLHDWDKTIAEQGFVEAARAPVADKPINVEDKP